MTKSYTVNKGVIHSPGGIPESPRWFSDSRLAFQMDESAITQVDYFNPSAHRGSTTLFLQRLRDGIRYFLEKDQTTYSLPHRDTQVWPFGVESSVESAGALFTHRVMAVEESIVIQLTTPAEMPDDVRFKLEFYEDFGLTPVDSGDFRFNDRGAKRKWRDWAFDAGRGGLFGAFDETRIEEEHHGETSVNDYSIKHEIDRTSTSLHIGVGADFPLGFLSRTHAVKFMLTGEQPLQPNRTYSFVIAFAPERAELYKRLDGLLCTVGSAVEKQFERYRKVSERIPTLSSPYPALNDFISLSPMVHESCKVTDVPGAVKAKNTTYWVWGWDGITSNYASLYWGDRDFIRDMLLFYEETADPKRGIAHSYRHDMKLNSVSSLPAQGMYISLLHQYYAASGDEQTVKDRYAFTRKIFESIRSREAQGTGLCEQASLFPDYPALMKETGEDISSLNNTIWYCAARSMEALADVMKDDETRSEAAAMSRRIEEHFLPLFFDKEKGFVVSSIDSVTMQRRDSFNSNAVKWENHYCGELMEPVAGDSLDFFEKNIVCKAGLREIPVWSSAYDMDANQLHCWWPVTGEYYMRLINGADRRDRIEQWIGWVSYWTKMLTCPEGISCYIDTDEPDVDRWNSAKGTWHAYSVRGWYQAAIHGVVGVGMEAGGLTLYPYSGEEMTLHGLHFQNKTFDIAMKGSGPYVQTIEIDGATIRATNKLPVDVSADSGHSNVTVHRTTERPFPVIIEQGYGVSLLDYAYEDGVVRTRVQGSGTCRLKLSATREPVVTVDGRTAEVRYDADTGTAIVLLDLTAGLQEELVIK